MMALPVEPSEDFDISDDSLRNDESMMIDSGMKNMLMNAKQSKKAAKQQRFKKDNFLLEENENQIINQQNDQNLHFKIDSDQTMDLPQLNINNRVSNSIAGDSQKSKNDITGVSRFDDLHTI